MGVQNQKAVKNLLIAKSLSSRTGVAAANISAGLTDGEIVVTDVSGKILDSASVVFETAVQIVQGQASGLPKIVSPVIKKAGIRTYKGGKFLSETPQIDFVGYNGTSGSIDVLNSNPYDLRIYQWDHAAFAEKSHAVIGYHKSDSTATQAEIAAGVQLVATDTLKGLRLPSAPFKIELIQSASISGGMTGPTALAFVNGSKVVTATTSTALSGGPVAGDFLAVDQAAGTPVYKIKSVTAASGNNPAFIVLESFYQGATASPVIANVGQVSAATAASANFGLKISGVTQTVSSSNVLNGGLEDYFPVRFKTIANGFGSTTVATGTPFVAGNGLPVQVAVLERQLLGNEGYLTAGAMPYVSPRSNTNFSANGYSFIHLEYSDYPVNSVLGLHEQPKQLDIALEADSTTPTFTALGYNVTGSPISVFDVLQSWLVTNGPFSSAVIQ